MIVEIENELYFIDKHAAHERMNFERFRAQATVETQMLLAPVVVNLTKDEFIAISENVELIKKCGFELEEFGESQIIVRAIPSLVDGDSVKDLMLEIAQKLLEHKTDILPDKIDWIYHPLLAVALLRQAIILQGRSRKCLLKSFFQCLIFAFALMADPCL